MELRRSRPPTDGLRSLPLNEKYERLGTPLEDHELMRQDHQRQRSLQEIREYARREAAKMPPLPDDVLEKVATLLSQPTPDSQIMHWRLRLFCGHIIQARRHCTMTRPTDHGCSSPALSRVRHGPRRDRRVRAGRPRRRANPRACSAKAPCPVVFVESGAASRERSTSRGAQTRARSTPWSQRVDLIPVEPPLIFVAARSAPPPPRLTPACIPASP